MKKFTSYIAMMMIALTSLTFTSCNDDEDIANTLWGVWKGEMYVTTYWGDYYYDASYSEIAFDKDPYQYASGTGYWIDYYSNAPWDYHANHIRWTISNGVIRIRYVEDGGYVDIYDYRLDYNYFTGSIQNDYGEELNFRLRKVESPDYWDWDDYEWGWSGWRSNYMPTRATGDKTAGDSPTRVFRAR